MPTHRYPFAEEDFEGKCKHVSLPLHVLSVSFDRIASHIPITSVMALSRTHSSLMPKLESHLQYSFNNLLASRVPTAKISCFNKLLLDTRAAISGSTALHFLLRDIHWRPGDFDLYAPFGTGYTLAKWLTIHAGYRMVSDGSRNFSFRPHMVVLPEDGRYLDFATSHYNMQAIQSDKPRYEIPGANIYRVFKLCKGVNAFIDVIESSTLSFLPSITQFHSTLVMNYLTPESLVVLYPTFTFRREGILQFRDANTLEEYDPPADRAVLQGDTNNQDYIIKYRARGFTLSSTASDLRRPCGAACPALIRTVFEKTDKWTLELNFAVPAGSARIENMSNYASGSRSIGESGLDHPPPAYSSHINPSPAQNSSDYRLRPPLLNSIQLNIDPGPRDVTPPESESGSQGLLVVKATRPPLPALTWSLRARRKKKVTKCTNEFCPQQGNHLSTVAPFAGSGG